MLSRIKQLGQSRFVRNVAVVATGTAGAQAITMAFSPIIARLYGPEALGSLGTFTAILAVLMPLAALSYPIAIVLPKRDADAVGLARLAIRIALVISCLTMLVLLLFRSQVVAVLNLQSIERFILLLPVAMFFSTCMAVLSQWVVRKKLFRLTAKIAVLQALWLNSAKAGVGLLSPIAAMLIILATLGSALHAAMLWLGIKKSPQGRPAGAQQEEESPLATQWELAVRHRDFALYRTPQIILNAAAQSMPVLMLASFAGPAAAGFYTLGKMVLGMPAQLIGQSVASVFYPRINEAVHKGEDPHRLLLRATAALAGAGLVPFGLVVLFGPWLFSLVFGTQWHTAGVYAQWLALWSYFALMNRPSVGAIPVLGLQGFFLAYEVASIGLRAVFLWLGFVVFDSALVAVALFSLVSVALNMALIVATLIAASRLKTKVGILAHE